MIARHLTDAEPASTTDGQLVRGREPRRLRTQVPVRPHALAINTRFSQPAEPEWTTDRHTPADLEYARQIGRARLGVRTPDDWVAPLGPSVEFVGSVRTTFGARYPDSASELKDA